MNYLQVVQEFVRIPLTLDAWARAQDDTPWLRFQSQLEGDYGTEMEAVGDADAVSASTLGFKNLQRIVKMLPKMALRAGESNRDLKDLYTSVIGQWYKELTHVVALVGGYDHRTKYGSQPGPISTPVSKAQQARAVAFLNEQLFAGAPEWLLDPKVLERMPTGAPANTMGSAQRFILTSLLNPSRLTRLHAQSQALGDKAYRVEQLLADLRGGTLSELKTGAAPDGPRRNVQRGYVAILTNMMAYASSSDDGRAALRAEVKSLNKQFAEKAKTASDGTTKAHWGDLADLTGKALNPLTATQLPDVAKKSLHQQDQEELDCWHVDDMLSLPTQD